MKSITLKIPNDAFVGLGHRPHDELRMLAAVKLFELKRLSSGTAARLAGITRVEFLQRLADYGSQVFDVDAEQFARESRLG